MNDIKSLLAEAASVLQATSDSPKLDAEVILCFLLKKPRSYIRTWPDFIVETQKVGDFWALIKQRQQGVPVAYITGKREFWSREFTVNRDVLIPRPDTEVIVDLCLTLIPKNKVLKLLDLGTGSGIIAITLSAECPMIQTTATDLSVNALEVAKINAKAHRLENIQFIQSDWFLSLSASRYSIIVSNPPYIDAEDEHLLQPELKFEPQTALIADENGLADINNIVSNAGRFLEAGGHLLIEHGYQQQFAVQGIFKDCHYHNIKTHTDLAGRPRVTYGQWM
jgi:release factor glutamine methyltransferase